MAGDTAGEYVEEEGEGSKAGKEGEEGAGLAAEVWSEQESRETRVEVTIPEGEVGAEVRKWFALLRR